MPKANPNPRTVFLQGGKSRKGGTTVRVGQERYLGGRAEGTVFESKITVSKIGKDGSTRERTATLARKEFNRRSFIEWGGNFRKPKKQFVLVRELIDLNKKKKLGLRLPKTIRLIEEPGKISLATTFYPKYEKTGLRKKLRFWQLKEKRQFAEDVYRQIDILEREGYSALKWNDVFKPLIQPNRECVAMILDFGSLIKTEKKSKP